MKKAVFIIGVLRTPEQAISNEEEEFLKEIADLNDLDVEVLFAIENNKLTGDEKKVRAAHIKEERPRLVKQIKEIAPEYVFCFGRIAAASAFAKGSVVLNDLRRRSHTIDDIGGRTFVCDSLQRAEAQPGIRGWIKLDIAAALAGFNDTVWGDYTVLMPGTPEWDVCPKDFGTTLGFDLETYPGLNPWAPDARIRMAMLSDACGSAYVIQATSSSDLPTWLVNILEDSKYTKVGSNIAFDYRWCNRFGYKLNNIVDTSTMQHIIDSTDPNKGLKWLTLRYLPRLGTYDRELTALRNKRGRKNDWHLIEDHEMYQYAGADAEASYEAWMHQQPTLALGGFTMPAKLMCDLYPVLARMTTDGMCVDPEVTQNLDAEMDKHLSELRREICEILGPINLNSPTQLAKALVKFIPGIDLRQRQWVRFLSEDDNEEDMDQSTSRAILEREADKHPIIALVLEFRRWSKLHTAFVKTMLDKHMVYHGGRHYCHPSFNTAVVETYRLSGSSPNVQQVPRKPKEGEDSALNIKRQFVSRFKHGTLLHADYGQMEMRIAAMLSDDKNLLAAIEEEDVHTTVAALMYGKDAKEITKDDRRVAKTIGFATMYGAGARTIGKHLGIHKEEAKLLMDVYFRTYPGLRRYIHQVHQSVQIDCQTRTLWGFERTFAPPPNGNWNQWEGFRVQRQAFNTIIQSAAACVMYVALIDLSRRMENAKVESRLVATVHDSLLVDIAPGELDLMVNMVKASMASPPTKLYGVDITVPLTVDIEVGKNWGEMKEVG